MLSMLKSVVLSRKEFHSLLTARKGTDKQLISKKTWNFKPFFFKYKVPHV